MSTRQLLPLIGALFALYIIWGSTYFAIAVGVASWPPLMMAGIRFLAAGVLLLGWLLATGHKLPARRPLLNAALIGVLLLAVGNGFVTLAEHQHVPSGIAAVMVATVPLFTLCFSRFFGIATRKLEWLGHCHWPCGYRDAQQRRQPERQPLGRTADPDWFPKLGLRLGLRFANRTADRHDGGGNRDARRRDRPAGGLMAER